MKEVIVTALVSAPVGFSLGVAFSNSIRADIAKLYARVEDLIAKVETALAALKADAQKAL